MEVKKRMRENLDFISDLPDLILTHILSFLTTREAVHTFILSKRWCSLWAYASCLHFDSKEFKRDLSFEHFVSSVMFLRRIGHLDTFRLKWALEQETFGHGPIVKAWLLRVLECNPRVIDINCPIIGLVGFPSSLFCCSSLVEVNIDLYGYEFSLPYRVSLPYLRKLYLRISNISNEYMEKIMSGCPSFEELELNGPVIDGAGESSFVISSTVLKHLRLVDCFFIFCKLSVSTPCLLSLHLNGSFIEGVILNNMPSLMKASLHSCDAYDNCCHVLDSLANVTELELLGDGLKESLERTTPKCPLFYNLKQLTLNECFNGDRENHGWMHIFSVNSPNIEKTTFYSKLYYSKGSQFPPNPNNDHYYSDETSFDDIDDDFINGGPGDYHNDD